MVRFEISFFDISNLVNAADLRYMLERIEAGCDRMSQPDRARAAWILFKNGKRQKAGELVAALREHLVHILFVKYIVGVAEMTMRADAPVLFQHVPKFRFAERHQNVP